MNEQGQLSARLSKRLHDTSSTVRRQACRLLSIATMVMLDAAAESLTTDTAAEDDLSADATTSSLDQKTNLCNPHHSLVYQASCTFGRSLRERSCSKRGRRWRSLGRCSSLSADGSMLRSNRNPNCSCLGLWDNATCQRPTSFCAEQVCAIHIVSPAETSCRECTRMCWRGEQ